MFTVTSNATVYELLDHVNTLLDTDRAAAIHFIKNQRAKVAMEEYLRMGFDASVEFILPAGEPPYRTDPHAPIGYGLTDLKQELRRMRLFMKHTANPGVSPSRLESLWVQVLEGLHYKEAKLLSAIKDRNVTSFFHNIDADFIREVYPQWATNLASPVVVEPIDLGSDPAHEDVKELIIGAIINDPDVPKKAKAEVMQIAGVASAKKPRKPRQQKVVVEVTPDATPAAERKKPGRKPKAKDPASATEPAQEQPVKRKPGRPKKVA